MSRIGTHRSCRIGTRDTFRRSGNNKLSKSLMRLGHGRRRRCESRRLALRNEIAERRTSAHVACGGPERADGIFKRIPRRLCTRGGTSRPRRPQGFGRVHFISELFDLALNEFKIAFDRRRDAAPLCPSARTGRSARSGRRVVNGCLSIGARPERPLLAYDLAFWRMNSGSRRLGRRRRGLWRCCRHFRRLFRRSLGGRSRSGT